MVLAHPCLFCHSFHSTNYVSDAAGFAALVHVVPDPGRTLAAITPKNLCNLICISQGMQLVLNVMQHYNAPRPNCEESPYMMAAWYFVRSLNIRSMDTDAQVYGYCRGYRSIHLARLGTPCFATVRV